MTLRQPGRWQARVAGRATSLGPALRGSQASELLPYCPGSGAGGAEGTIWPSTFPAPRLLPSFCRTGVESLCDWPVGNPVPPPVRVPVLGLAALCWGSFCVTLVTVDGEVLSVSPLVILFCPCQFELPDPCSLLTDHRLWASQKGCLVPQPLGCCRHGLHHLTLRPGSSLPQALHFASLCYSVLQLLSWTWRPGV